ncbi:glutamate-cysteine ligase modifier subunit [Oratosquilla oratoria]|uniref:glutamate-cysteine ligase modifier subunit n=1 Tax=Oratosquilla oratoria TaxID=337810 RepID=UPI003F759639
MPSPAKRVIVSTGNILDLSDLIRKAGQSSAEEVKAGIQKTLQVWDGSNPGVEPDVLHIIRHSETPLTNDDRGRTNTVKLFMYSSDASLLSKSIDTILKEYKVQQVESLILALPSLGEDPSLQDVQGMWRAMEKMVDSGKVTNIGIADVSTQLFMDLYAWAMVKPSTVQVNLSSCCVVPEDLTSFAKENLVQVLTHNDPIDMGDEALVQEILQKLALSGESWKLQWMGRLRAVQQCRGILQCKGYVLSVACTE